MTFTYTIFVTWVVPRFFFCIKTVCSVFLNSNIILYIILDDNILIFYKNFSTELYEWHKLIDSISICYSIRLI